MDLSKSDSAWVEYEILRYKNTIFYEMFTKSKIKTYEANNLPYPDEKLTDLIYYYNSGFNPEWMINKKGRDKLIEKWLSKNGYDPKEHSIEGSSDMARALDFYNSDDLSIYMDSLRHSEYLRMERENESENH
jgi:hypothetical protein